MASKRLVAHDYPIGTVVSAYVREAMTNGGPPIGNAVDASTVQSDGSVTFDGLTEGRRYVAWAANRPVSFFMEEGSLDLLKPIRGQEAMDLRRAMIPEQYVTSAVGIFAGAAGDGVTDDKNAFQAHLDFAAGEGGGRVVVPEGRYKLSGTLKIASSVSLVGAGPNSVLVSNEGWSGSVVTATGTIGTEMNLTGDYGRGDSVFVTAAAHGLAPGDYVRIIGQRNALSDDADPDYRLGYGTPGSPCAYFAEFMQVNTVDTATQFTTYAGLVFRDYRDDKTLDADPNARARSTIQKVSFVQDVAVEGFHVEIGTGQVSTTSAFVRMDYARNVTVRNCTVAHGEQVGNAVYMKNSLDCTGDSISCEYEQGEPLDPAVHAQYTSFYFNSCQACKYRDCISRNSGQNFDVSYSNLGCVSLFCSFVGNRVYSPWSSGMTSHGGAYAISFLNNELYGCHQGIACRSRNSIISGNIAVYNGEEGAAPTSYTHYAYGIYEGWAADCVITGNTAVGYHSGVGIIDAADAGETFRYAGVSITGNTFTKCVHGVYRLKASSAVEDCRGVVISGNVFHDCSGAVVYLESTDDVVISGNMGHDIVIGIDLDDCESGTITGNVIRSNTVGVGDGLDLANDTTGFTVTGNVWADFENGVRLNSSVGNVVTGNNFDGCTSNVATAHVGNIVTDNPFTGSVSIASASTIEVPSDMRYVNLTGTAAVNTITADHIGRVILVRLASTATITNAGNVKLAATFGGAVDETIALMCDGVNWRPFMRDA